MSFLYYLDHPGHLGVIDRGVMSDVVRASAEGTQLAAPSMGRHHNHITPLTALAWDPTAAILPLSEH